MLSCSQVCVLFPLFPLVYGQQCPFVPCIDDSDCNTVGCSWCSSPSPKADRTCSGPPDAKDCGTLPQANRTAKLQYAYWGDSVSKGTFPIVSKLLGYEAFHPANNFGGACGNVIKAHYCGDLWLNGADGVASARKWDLVTFNFGLHDTAHDAEFVDLEVYKRNLKEVAQQLQERAVRVFWISTTPVPNASALAMWSQGDIPVYNAAAKEVMGKLNIPIVDLYSFVIEQCGGDEHYSSCSGFQKQDNVHFEKAGYMAMAQFIYDAVTGRSPVPSPAPAPSPEPSPTPQPPLPVDSNCSFQNSTTYQDDVFKTTHVPLNDYVACCELCHADSRCAAAQMVHGSGTVSFDLCKLMATADAPVQNVVSPPSLELACIPKRKAQLAALELV